MTVVSFSPEFQQWGDGVWHREVETKHVVKRNYMFLKETQGLIRVSSSLLTPSKEKVETAS